MSKDKTKKSTLDREEFGYGYDISVDDLNVIGQNQEARKHNNNKIKEKNLKVKEVLKCRNHNTQN